MEYSVGTTKPERDPWIYNPVFFDKDVNSVKEGKASTNSGVPE